jgi:hypothetical protein
MLNHIVVFRAAMTRTGEMSKPKPSQGQNQTR